MVVLLNSVRVVLLAVESHIVELPLIWTLDDALAASPFLVALWTLLVHEGWGDLVASALAVVLLASGEGWLHVELATVDVGLGLSLELAEPKHELVDVVGEGDVGWVDLDWRGDGLDQDTLLGSGHHFQNEAVLTVLLSALAVGDVVDEAWVASLSGALLGLRVVWPSFWADLLLALTSLRVELEAVLADGLLALLGLLLEDVSFWAGALDALVSLWHVDEVWWALLLGSDLVHLDNASLSVELVVVWAGDLDALLALLGEAFWAAESDALVLDSLPAFRTGLDSHALSVSFNVSWLTSVSDALVADHLVVLWTLDLHALLVDELVVLWALD